MKAVSNIDNDLNKNKVSILFCLLAKLISCETINALNNENPEELKKYFDGRVGQAEGLDSVLSCAEEGDTLDVALEKLEDFYAEFFK